jgi:hypothetical protein
MKDVEIHNVASGYTLTTHTNLITERISYLRATALLICVETPLANDPDKYGEVITVSIGIRKTNGSNQR